MGQQRLIIHNRFQFHLLLTMIMRSTKVMKQMVQLKQLANIHDRSLIDHDNIIVRIDNRILKNSGSRWFLLTRTAVF